MAFKRLNYKVLGALLLAVVMAGCGFHWYQPTRDVRYRFTLIEKDMAYIYNDCDGKTRFYNVVITRTTSPNARPYPQMTQDLKDMRASADAIQGMKPALNSLKADFETVAQGREGFSSDKPEWSEWEKFNGRLSDFLRQFKGQMRGYNQASADFQTLVSDFHIRNLNAEQARQEIAAYLAGLDQISPGSRAGSKRSRTITMDWQ